MSNDNIPPAVREMFIRYDRRLKEIERRLTGIGAIDSASIPVGAVNYFNDDRVSSTTLASGASETSAVITFTPVIDTHHIQLFFFADITVSVPAGGVRTWQGSMTLQWNHPTLGWSFVTGHQPRVLIDDDGLRHQSAVPGVLPTGVMTAALPAGVPIEMRIIYDNEDIFGSGADAFFHSLIVAFANADITI